MRRPWLALLPYALLAAVFLVAASLFLVNGVSGRSAGLSSLPLDEAWTRLTYATSFGEHLRFSFDDASNEAGVTSPLWTALVGLTWRATGLEAIRVVAVAKLFGVAFGIASGMLTFRLVSRLTGDRRLGFLAGALLLIQPEFVFASVSGLEVTLAATLVLASAWAFYEGRMKTTGVLLALLVLARPETVVFVAVVAVALIARRMWQREQLSFLDAADVRSLAALLLPTLLLGGAFAVFNFSVNGGPAPNSYYAGHVDLGLFPFGNLANALRGYFHSLPLFAGYVFPVTVAIFVAGSWSIAHHHGFRAAPISLFVLAQTYAVVVTLPVPPGPWPFLFRRLLDVSLPFVVIAVVVGWTAIWRQFADWRAGNAPSDPREMRLFNFGLNMLFIVIVAAPFIGLAGRWGKLTADYSWNSKNVDDVQVATAHWISANVAPTDLLAVDSPGAIAFFTDNPLVDLTGVNSHEAIGREVFQLMQDLQVSYLFAFSSVHFDSWVNGREAYRVDVDRNTVLPSSTMKGWKADWEATVELVSAAEPHIFDPAALGLRIIDSVDVGNPEAAQAASESQHEYVISGNASRVEREFRLDSAGTTVKDDARTYTGTEEFVVKAEPGRRLVVAKRYDAAVAGAVRVFVDGVDAGIWELPQRDFFFGESTFPVPAELVKSNAVRLRFAYVGRPGGLPANSYYYWVMVDG